MTVYVTNLTEFIKCNPLNSLEWIVLGLSELQLYFLVELNRELRLIYVA